MKRSFTGSIVLALFLSASPSSSGEAEPIGKTISEREVRIVSARLYTAILVTACNNGWRYPLKRVESGFERHFNELRLQLVTDGYIIVASSRLSDGSKPSPINLVGAGNRSSPWIGCAGPYWLESRGRE